MYHAGLSTEDIAAELEMTSAAVRVALQEAGLTLKPGRKSSAEALTAEERAQLISSYIDAGVPAIQLISKYGITWNAFYKILDDADVPYREMKREDRLAREKRLDRAVQMYQGGARIWEIEGETGIRQPVLHSALHSRGIPLRRASAQGQE